MGLFAWLRKKAGGASGARSEPLVRELWRSAATLRAEARAKEALPLAQRAADLARMHLGGAHPDYAGTLGNLADVYDETGHHAAALPLFKRAAEIIGAALGEAHPD